MRSPASRAVRSKTGASHVRAVGEHGDAVDRFGRAGFTRGQRGLLGDGAGQRGLGGDGFDHDRPFRRGEAEPRAVRRGEVRQGGFEIAQRNDQRGLGAGVAQMQRFGGRYVLGRWRPGPPEP